MSEFISNKVGADQLVMLIKKTIQKKVLSEYDFIDIKLYLKDLDKKHDRMTFCFKSVIAENEIREKKARKMAEELERAKIKQLKIESEKAKIEGNKTIINFNDRKEDITKTILYRFYNLDYLNLS